MSGRGIITRRAVFSSRFRTFSIIIRSLRERCPPATLSATMSRSSSSEWASSVVLVWPSPSTQSVKLLALFKSQITGENTYDRITRGGAVRSTKTLGGADRQALGCLLAQRHVEECHQRERDHRHGRDRDTEDHNRVRGEPDASERRS